MLRLIVNDWARLPDERLPRVFVAGLDELPYASRTFRSGDQLIVERREGDSGCVWAPWTHAPLSTGERLGEWLLGTSTLMEREEPYLFELELARGSVYRLRNQLANWQQLGLDSTQELDALIAEATRHFSRAATHQHDPAVAAGHAERAIQLAAEASLLLCGAYATQAMEVRLKTAQRLPTLLGVGLNGATPEAKGPIADAFSSVVVRCVWNAVEENEGKRRWAELDAQVEWAKQAGVRLCAGPLLDFSDHSIPDWAYLWEGDFEALATLMTSHVESVVRRYRGRVQLWNVAGRVNRRRALGLTDEQRLQLVARAVRTVQSVYEAESAAQQPPIVVSFDQPWGEYLSAEPSDLAPIDFADALERADLGIAGFGLELNVGYSPDGTSLRNPIDFSRLLDFWSLRLELPLMLQLALPSGRGGDPLASSRSVVSAAGDARGDAAPIDPVFQAAWVTRCLPMLLAKNCVQVVAWSTHRDDQPHAYPHSGLIDADGNAKPALAALRRLRETYLT
ncbi:MAG: endo-1,4-beta-xylanase [Planctomycetota bacterium]